MSTRFKTPWFLSVEEKIGLKSPTMTHGSTERPLLILISSQNHGLVIQSIHSGTQLLREEKWVWARELNKDTKISLEGDPTHSDNTVPSYDNVARGTNYWHVGKVLQEFPTDGSPTSQRNGRQLCFLKTTKIDTRWFQHVFNQESFLRPS